MPSPNLTLSKVKRNMAESTINFEEIVRKVAFLAGFCAFCGQTANFTVNCPFEFNRRSG